MMDYITHNLFSTEAGVVWLVLKWVLVVLAAGFIGQFGKALAAHLIRKAQERKRRGEGKTAERPAPPAAGPVAGPDAAAAPDAPANVPAARKAQKKALKEQQKADKKARKAMEKRLKD